MDARVGVQECSVLQLVTDSELGEICSCALCVVWCFAAEVSPAF